MSAVRGSRNAADFSTAIAPPQSSASTAFLPAANSGASFAQSASGIATVIVQIGHSSVLASAVCSGPPDRNPVAVCHSEGPIVYAATPATSAPRRADTVTARIILVCLFLPVGPAAPSSNAISRRTAILSLPRQERLGL